MLKASENRARLPATIARGRIMGSNRAGVRVKARKARRIKNDRKIAEAAQKRKSQGQSQAGK
jgi:hypothetical protein